MHWRAWATSACLVGQRLGHEERADGVDPQHLEDGLGPQLAQRPGAQPVGLAGRRPDAGVVDEEIDGVEPLADEDALHRLRDRLKGHGCEVTDVVDHDIMRSIYFTDPNGIALEASWWTLDVTGRPSDLRDEHVFADPDPVAAVVELREQGRLASTPATSLVDDITTT